MALSAKSLMNAYDKDIQGYITSATKAQAANNKFNAQQAELNRNFQYSMSSTAHQREVEDLKAAGINPILSAYSGGASTGSGSAASADNSLSQVFGGLAQTAMNTASNLASAIETANAARYGAKTSANASMKNAKTAAAAAVETSKISAQAHVDAAELAAAATRYASDNSVYAAIQTAKISASMQKTVAKISSKTNIKTSKINAAVDKYAAQLKYAADIKETDAKTYREMMKTLTQEMASFLRMKMDDVESMINSIIPIFM